MPAWDANQGSASEAATRLQKRAFVGTGAPAAERVQCSTMTDNWVETHMKKPKLPKKDKQRLPRKLKKLLKKQASIPS